MSEADTNPKDRDDEIAHLQKELAATKAELAATQGAPLAEGADPFEGSQRRMIVVGIAILLVGLAMMWGVFTLLSKGFSSFANQAAESLTPHSAPNSPPSSGHRAPTPTGSDKAPPMAPGL